MWPRCLLNSQQPRSREKDKKKGEEKSTSYISRGLLPPVKPHLLKCPSILNNGIKSCVGGQSLPKGPSAGKPAAQISL